MKIHFLPIFLTALLIWGCDTERFELGEPFELEYAEVAQEKNGNLTLTFLAVTEDSRCPRNTECIWEGQVKVQISASGAVQEVFELTLRAGQTAAATTRVGNYEIALNEVTPYPESGKKIEKDDYEARLVVTMVP